VDIACALAFDHGGVIIDGAQIDLHPERAAQIVHEKNIALKHACGVFGGHN